MLFRKLLISFSLGLFLLVNVSTGFAADKIKVVTTIGMIQDAVENIGGEYVSVAGLMGPGVDPHLYRATEGDVMKLASADIIFYGGLHLEAKMGDIFEQMRTRIKTVAVSDGVPRDRLISAAAFQGSHDPHIWFDVELWILAVKTICLELQQFDPVHADFYSKNLEYYLSQLQMVHEYIKTRALEVPLEQRVIVTAHDAFNYFGRAYGYEVVGLQGISTESEAGIADVQKLADMIVTRKIPAIFIETSIPIRNIQAVQEAVKAKGWDVKIGGQLFSDAMGTRGTPEGTYVGMVRHNINTIVDSLLNRVVQHKE